MSPLTKPTSDPGAVEIREVLREIRDALQDLVTAVGEVVTELERARLERRT